ncbi:hypothetical protein DOJK_00703 [Patescibacteria group bacterium]|nr:hypothetical protein DOJK_00703 [Patescibacteria group bacterium]
MRIFNKQTLFKKSMLALSLMALMTGCDSFGPDAIRGTHPLYNDAIVGSMNEQFIQNIVRLHYRDPIFFLDVSNVTANLKLEVSGGFDQSSLGVGPGDTSNVLRYSLGAGYTTSPTISYAPLQGEAFVKSMLSPIPLETLFSLTGSGWSARRIFGLCVERINGIENAVAASGPTPKLAPNQSEKFNRLLQLIEEVRKGQLITPTIDAQTKQARLQIKSSPEFSNQIREIKDLLGLDQNLEFYFINTDFTKTGADTVSIRPRSLNSIFFYLSHHVDTPLAHKTAQLVTVTKDKNGAEFDWSSTPAGQLFHIRQSEEQPTDAFIALPYRDHWFYVADNDLESKSTFMLLMQLFRLQAGSAKSEGPTLTLPVR